MRNVLLIVLFLLLILISSCRPINLVDCNVDSDCIKVPADCCGCAADGSATTINKEYEEWWQSNKGCYGPCWDVLSDDPTCLAPPRCVQNKCILDLEVVSVPSSENLRYMMGATDKIYISNGLRQELEPGEIVTGVVGIQNFDKNLDLTTKFSLEVITLDHKGEEDWFIVPQPVNIKSGEKAAVQVKVKLPSTLLPGSSYSFKVVVKKNNEEYASKPIIIHIKKK